MGEGAQGGAHYDTTMFTTYDHASYQPRSLGVFLFMYIWEANVHVHQVGVLRMATVCWKTRGTSPVTIGTL